MSHSFPPPSSGAVKTPRWVYLALACSVLLCAVALVFFYASTRTASGPERGATHKVVVDDTRCEPGDFTLPAGLTTFEIHNASRRPIEWEILEGVMVVAERENIAPGFYSLLTVKLRPGTFVITCGLLSNPRGALVVTPTAASEAERMRPPVQSFIGPLSENRVYSITQSNRLVREVTALNAAIAAQDVALARTHWTAAHSAYQRLAPIAGRFADLDARINPQAQYLEAGLNDAHFIGLPKLAQWLFAPTAEASEGAAMDWAQAAAVGQTLAGDGQELQARIRALQQRPDDLTDNAIWLIQRINEGVLAEGGSAETSIPATRQLDDLQANLEGMRKSALLLAPLLQAAQPAQAAALVGALDHVQGAIEAAQQEAATAPQAPLNASQKQALARSLQALSESLAQVNAALGLE